MCRMPLWKADFDQYHPVVNNDLSCGQAKLIQDWCSSPPCFYCLGISLSVIGHRDTDKPSGEIELFQVRKSNKNGTQIIYKISPGTLPEAKSSAQSQYQRSTIYKIIIFIADNKTTKRLELKIKHS